MAQAKLIRSVRAFGYDLTQMGMPTGDSYSYVIPYRMPRAEFTALQLWTKGHVRVRNAGVDMPDRHRGVLTTELDDVLEAGILTLSAVDYAEWWCLDARKNGGVLPPVRRFERAVGAHLVESAEVRLLVCDGALLVDGVEYGTGAAVVLPAGTGFEVTADLIGLQF